MNLAFAVVISFATGFAVGVTVYDAKANSEQCERSKENAERFATVIAHALNGGEFGDQEVTARCRVKKNP